MFDYFRGANVVKTQRLNPITFNHCLNIDFISRLESRDEEAFRDMFGKDLGRMDEYVNTGALGNSFRRSDVYDSTKMNFRNTGKGLTGSRSKDNDRIANVQNWSMFAHQAREKGERKCQKCKCN